MLNEVPVKYTSDPLLSAQQLTFAYNGSPMLKDVSFSMESGEFVGLLGPNGAGKSTLLKLVGGVMRGGQNNVDLMGKTLGRYRANALARMIAYVPQSTALDFAFTVREVVLMGRSPYLGRFQIESAADRAIAETAMRTTDVLSFADRFINTLSGGERQRVIIARALAQEPALLLLDEPTSNLDIKHQLAILELSQSLAHDCGIGVVAAIHDLSLAARFCDRIVLMDEGRIVAQGKPTEVLTPQRLNEVFGVDVIVEQEPTTGGLRLTLLRTAHHVS